MKNLSIIMILFSLALSLQCVRDPGTETDLTGQEVEYISEELFYKGFLVYDKKLKEKDGSSSCPMKWWGQQ